MKHWVFDLDGTLVDSLTVHFQVLEKVFAHFGQSFTKDDHREVLKVNSKTLPNYFASKLGVDYVSTALEMFQRYTLEALPSIQPFPGIKDLLSTLKQRDRSLALWTARDFATTKEILNHTGLGTYFSIWVSACCTSQAKPHPEGLQKIADHFATDSSTVVMVGDFESDMLGAQAFGSKAVRVFWHPVVERKKCEIAHWQFEEVSEFQSWIENSRELQ